jgi:hypothetical protein
MNRWEEWFRKQLEKYNSVGARNERWGATFYKFEGKWYGRYYEVEHFVDAPPICPLRCYSVHCGEWKCKGCPKADAFLIRGDKRLPLFEVKDEDEIIALVREHHLFGVQGGENAEFVIEIRKEELK